MSDITQAQADAVLGAARESARETGTAGSTVENDHTLASAGAAGRR